MLRPRREAERIFSRSSSAFHVAFWSVAEIPLIGAEGLASELTTEKFLTSDDSPQLAAGSAQSNDQKRSLCLKSTEETANLVEMGIHKKEAA